MDGAQRDVILGLAEVDGALDLRKVLIELHIITDPYRYSELIGVLQSIDDHFGIRGQLLQTIERQERLNGHV